MKRTCDGFTIVELMVAMVIFMIICAMAIPNYMSALQRAHEAAAATFLRQVQSSEEAYRLSSQQYADTFHKLQPYMSPDTSGSTPAPPSDTLVYSKYVFDLTLTDPTHWQCAGQPISDRLNSKFFYTDQTNVIHVSVGNIADSLSPQL
jgi:type II secretory pathway pseudopilin PulG